MASGRFSRFYDSESITSRRLAMWKLSRNGLRVSEADFWLTKIAGASTHIWPVIITPMASDAFLSWANRTVLHAGREEPYLSIQDIVVFVRDLEVSKQFYLQTLG